MPSPLPSFLFPNEVMLPSSKLTASNYSDRQTDRQTAAFVSGFIGVCLAFPPVLMPRHYDPLALESLEVASSVAASSGTITQPSAGKAARWKGRVADLRQTHEEENQSIGNLCVTDPRCHRGGESKSRHIVENSSITVSHWP